jgi:hypothetical protein
MAFIFSSDGSDRTKNEMKATYPASAAPHLYCDAGDYTFRILMDMDPAERTESLRHESDA